MILSAVVASPPTDTDATPVLGVILHAVHYALILGGLVGVVALLLPQYAARVPVLRRLLPAPDSRLSEHDRRVAQLRASLAGSSASSSTPAPLALVGAGGAGRPRTDAPVVTGGTAPAARPPSLPPGVRVSPLVLPVAVVASAAAAAVHAAVGPEHFEEGLLLGLFFACSSTAQLGWSILVLRLAARRACPAWLLWSGAAGNLACLVLWGITRALGLPFGLLEGPEAVGPWDVAAGVWEALVVVSCLLVLHLAHRPATADGPRTEAGLAVGSWLQWHRAARLLVLVSFAVLVGLSFSGASA